MSVLTIKISGEVNTSASGVNILLDFYKKASEVNSTEIIVDFYDLDWFDANLSALFNALLYRLEKEHRVKLKTDLDFICRKFDVLIRNGCFKLANGSIEDIQKTTIPCASFNPDEQKDFINYIEEQLMTHRGMPALNVHLQKRIKVDLIEVFTNIFKHSESTDPFFVAGQYYPRMKYLIFTIADLGVGFLKPIQEFTNATIVTDKQAIVWALDGNTTKPNGLGGIGLQSIHDYCKCHKGIFQIMTGSSFWGTDLESTIFRGFRDLRHKYKGSVLNLFFNCE